MFSFLNKKINKGTSGGKYLSGHGTTENLNKGKNMSNRLFSFFKSKGFVMGKLNGVYEHVSSKGSIKDLKSQTSWGTSTAEILPLP